MFAWHVSFCCCWCFRTTVVCLFCSLIFVIHISLCCVGLRSTTKWSHSVWDSTQSTWAVYKTGWHFNIWHIFYKAIAHATRDYSTPCFVKCCVNTYVKCTVSQSHTSLEEECIIVEIYCNGYAKIREYFWHAGIQPIALNRVVTTKLWYEKYMGNPNLYRTEESLECLVHICVCVCLCTVATLFFSKANCA